MYKITHELYTQLAERLNEAITSLHYFAGTIEFEYDDADIRFVATLIPHHSSIELDGCQILTLRDITPVWWEIHTTTLDGECINDFDFKTFKEYLCQY